jgi:hypothetical protein
LSDDNLSSPRNALYMHSVLGDMVDEGGLRFMIVDGQVRFACIYFFLCIGFNLVRYTQFRRGKNRQSSILILRVACVASCKATLPVLIQISFVCMKSS